MVVEKLVEVYPVEGYLSGWYNNF